MYAPGDQPVLSFESDQHRQFLAMMLGRNAVIVTLGGSEQTTRKTIHDSARLTKRLLPGYSTRNVSCVMKDEDEVTLSLSQARRFISALCTNWHALQRNTCQYAYDVLACIVVCIVACIGGMY